jgi:hypothetical protein
MVWRVFSVFFLSLLTAMGCSAQKLPQQTFLPDRQVGYKPVKSALQALVLTQKSTQSVQHFCVIGYHLNSPAQEQSSKIAWVYWKEQNSLTYWEPAAQGFKPEDTLINSRRQLDLSKDVVATQAEVGSSSYLVSREWVDSTLKDCKKRGTLYTFKSR